MSATRGLVGGDDLLVSPPGHLDRGVLVVSEHGLEAGALPVGEQPEPGAKGASDAVERVPSASTVSEGVLLDALAAQVELVPGEGRHGTGPSP